MMDEGKDSLKQKVEALEKAEILNALINNGWIKAKAARKIGITERMIGYKIRKYGLEKEVKKHLIRTFIDKASTK